MYKESKASTECRHKALLLQRLIGECSVVVRAAYGSSKDIHVYTTVGMQPERIFTVGKCNRRLQTQCTHLAEGYSAHLTALQHDQYLAHAGE